ncbi:hypothetical protein BU17DRAFT_65111 [Hysterangium stoloniferum]|nr:hypothetical protein BU17DRAFT_65111 [Hysterangium stoloniferum]
MSIENEDAFKTNLLTLPKKLSDRLKNGETSQELVDWALDRIAAIKAETEADLAQYPHTSHRGIYGIGYKMLLATWTTFESQARLWRREQAGLTNSSEVSLSSTNIDKKKSDSTSSTFKKSRNNRDYEQGISKTPESNSPPRPVKLLKQGGYYISGANTAMKPAQERKTPSSDLSPPPANATFPKEPRRSSRPPPQTQTYAAPARPNP